MKTFSLYLILILDLKKYVSGGLWFGHVTDVTYDTDNFDLIWESDTESVSLNYEEETFETVDPLLGDPVIETTMKWMKKEMKYITVAEIVLRVDRLRSQPKKDNDVSKGKDKETGKKKEKELKTEPERRPPARPQYKLATILMDESLTGPLWMYDKNVLCDLFGSLWYRKESNGIVEIGVNLWEPKMILEIPKRPEEIKKPEDPQTDEIYGPHCMKIDYKFERKEERNQDGKLEPTLVFEVNIASKDYYCTDMENNFKPSSDFYRKISYFENKQQQAVVDYTLFLRLEPTRNRNISKKALDFKEKMEQRLKEVREEASKAQEEAYDQDYYEEDGYYGEGEGEGGYESEGGEEGVDPGTDQGVDQGSVDQGSVDQGTVDQGTMNQDPVNEEDQEPQTGKQESEKVGDSGKVETDEKEVAEKTDQGKNSGESFPEETVKKGLQEASITPRQDVTADKADKTAATTSTSGFEGKVQTTGSDAKPLPKRSITRMDSKVRAHPTDASPPRADGKGVSSSGSVKKPQHTATRSVSRMDSKLRPQASEASAEGTKEKKVPQIGRKTPPSLSKAQTNSKQSDDLPKKTQKSIQNTQTQGEVTETTTPSNTPGNSEEKEEESKGGAKEKKEKEKKRK